MYSNPLQEVVVLNFYKINVISAKISSYETSSNVKCKHFFSKSKRVKRSGCLRATPLYGMNLQDVLVYYKNCSSVVQSTQSSNLREDVVEETNKLNFVIYVKSMLA